MPRFSLKGAMISNLFPSDIVRESIKTKAPSLLAFVKSSDSLRISGSEFDSKHQNQ